MAERSPSRPPGWYRLFRFPQGRAQVEEDLDHELAFHLEQRAADLVAEGWRPEDARAEARRRFGDVATIRQSCLRNSLATDRRRRWRATLAELLADARFGWRRLRRRPLSSVLALTTLALGLGATTAVFAVLRAVALEPLPFADPEQLVWIQELDAGSPSGTSPGLALAWRDTGALEALVAIDQVTVTVGGETTLPERWGAQRVSEDFFQVFGVVPDRGRPFTRGEQAPGRDAVVILSHRLWQQRYAAAPDLLGQSILVDGRARQVVGIMPQQFALERDGPALWIPLALPASQRHNFGGNYLGLVGRRAADRPLEAVREALQRSSLARDLRGSDGAPREVVVEPLGGRLLAVHRHRLLILFAAVATVLFIGCLDVVHLQLVEGRRRSGELAMRAALGAERPRLLRQLLAESTVLAGLAAFAGLALAGLALRWLVIWLPGDLPRLDSARLDPAALSFGLLLALAAGLFCGLLPGLRGSRLDLVTSLRGGGLGGHRVGGGGGGNGRVGRPGRGGATLVILEVALAVVLVSAAGLLIRSGQRLAAVEPGFASLDALTARVALAGSAYEDRQKLVTTFEQIRDTVAAVPGVTSVALGSRVPLAGNLAGLDLALAETPESPVQAELRIAGPGFFDTLGVRRLAGRDFTGSDRPDSQPVVVVNQTLARLLGLDEAVSRQVITDTSGFRDADGTPIRWSIVGVVEDQRDQGLRSAPPPAFYLAPGQVPAGPWMWLGRQLLLVATTELDPTTIEEPLRRAVASVDPSLPLSDVQTMAQRLEGKRAVERFNTQLLSALGILALVLAAVGLFGVVSLAVATRRRELAVRAALGADPTALYRRVLWGALGPVALGIGLGLVASRWTNTLLARQLFEISPHDPMTLLAVAGLFLAVAGLAATLPARQAARQPPWEVLRGG